MELSEPQKEAAGSDERAIAVIAGQGKRKNEDAYKRIETLINEKKKLSLRILRPLRLQTRRQRR